MKTICGTNCCDKCDKRKECGGCLKCNGHPFNGKCIAAEYIKKHSLKDYQVYVLKLVKRINDLKIKDLEVENLFLLNGSYVNLEYKLPNGQKTKFLKDENIYLGCQVEIPNNQKCYGVITDGKFILVSKYGCNGSNPELVLYRKV